MVVTGRPADVDPALEHLLLLLVRLLLLISAQAAAGAAAAAGASAWPDYDDKFEFTFNDFNGGSKYISKSWNF